LYIHVKWRPCFCVTVWYCIQIQSEMSYPNHNTIHISLFFIIPRKGHFIEINVL
jgi:hypothetical protein